MKHPLIIFIVCIIVNSCTVVKPEYEMIRIEPNPYIKTIWINSYIDTTTDSKNNSINAIDTFHCVTNSSFDETFYKFKVFFQKDTVDFKIHNSYIGSNIDSIMIIIKTILDTSDIVVHPNSSWVRIGTKKALVGDACSNQCFVNSDIPVHVDITLIINSMIGNKNASYLDILQGKNDLRTDSIVHKLDSIINSIP